MSQFDPESEFDDVKRRVADAFEEALPFSTGKTEVKVNRVWVDDTKDSSDVRDQRRAVLNGRSWQVPIRAELTLTRDGKKLDTDTVIVGHLPKITDRYGYIVDGNEYQTNSLFRLKSGVYHRKAANDILISDFNLENKEQFANRKSLKIKFDPKDAIFYLKHGNSHVPMYHLLKSVGISDREIEKSWGKELAEKNKNKMSETAVFNKLHKVVGAELPKDPVEKRKLLKNLLEKTRMKRETTKKTLGKSFKSVDGDALLRSSNRLLAMSKGEDSGDDKNSLEFLSMHSAEDLIAERVKMSADRIKRKMSRGLDRKRTVKNLVPHREFDKAIKQFFHSSLSAQSEQTNPLDMMSGHRKTTIMGEQGGIRSSHVVSMDSKLVNPSHLGFLDPIHTPEGEKTGISLTLPLLAKKKGNELTSTFLSAKTGKRETVTPEKALRSVVAFPDQYEKKGKKLVARNRKVKATVEGRMVEVDPKEVDYVLPSARGIFGVSSNLIPFLQNNQGNRAMTAARQQEQAVPLLHREAPLVQVQTDRSGTFEDLMGEYASRKSPVDGVVERVSSDAIIIRKGRKKHEVQIYRDFPLKGHTLYDSKVLVKKGDKVKKGQLLADSTFTKEGKLALGTNLLTAYIPFKGYNFEDGIVISESASKKLTSLHSYRKDAVADANTVISKRKFLAEYPYAFSKKQVNKLGSDGVVDVGTVVEPGDPIALLLRKPDASQYNSKLRKFRRGRPDKYRDRSMTWDSDYKGVVTDVVRKGKELTVYIKTEEPAQQGDKLVGRHGNKGIITRIVPDAEMPYMKGKDGENRHVQIALNPLGIPGRINLGQVLETAAGKIAEKDGKPYKVKNFEPDSNYLGKVQADLKKRGLSDTEELINPDTGKPYDQKVLMGSQYILKQKHQVRKKMSARSGGYAMPYDINHAPAGGSPHGGQSLGELGMYAMLAHGARENLHEMYAYKSNKNDELWDALREGTPLPPPKVPFAHDKFLGYLNGMRVNVKKEGNSLQLVPFMESQITGKNGMSSGEIKEPGLAVRGKDLRPEKDGLFDEKITGGMDGTRWSHFSLAESMPNPLFEDAIRKLTGLKEREYREIVSGKKKINGKTGGKAIESLLSEIDVKKARRATRKRIESVRGERRSALHKKLRILKALDEQDLDPTVYMMKSVPILPPKFRPMIVKDDGNISSNDLNGLYKDVGAVNDLLKKNKKAGIPDDHLSEMRMELYDGLKALTGTGGSLTRKGEYKGILDIISGKTRKTSTGRAIRGTPKEGFFQRRVMKRRQDFTGRSTIVPEPRMGLDELGLPEEMAWTMYQPFIERELIKSGYKNLDAFDSVKKREPAAERALQKVVQERPILLKRDPALHMFNVMAFKPRLVKGKAIEIHPLVTSGYNADFDGDTMAVYLPISSKASKEAKGMYPSNNLFNPTTGAIQYTPGHEALLGMYMASKPGKRTKKAYKTPKDAASAYRSGHIGYTDVIKVGGKETTVARLEIESVLPSDMRETGRKSVSRMRVFDKKGTKTVLTEIAKKHPKLYGEVANKFKDIGNNYSTSMGYSVALDDFKVINKTTRDRLIANAQKEADAIRKGKGSSKKKEEKIINLYAKVDDQLDKLNTYHLKKYPTNISRMVDSGARGNFTQLKQIVSSPVLVKDGKDRVVPYIIPKSYSEGMDVASYWTTMHGARKGTVQKVQGVRDPGYITKQIQNSVMDQLVTEKDCGTSKGIYLSVNAHDILDRRLATDTKAGSQKFRKNSVVDTRLLSAAKKGKRQKILVRSALRCESEQGVCQACIGNKASGNSWDIGTNIGVISAHSVGEPSTQLSLNVFHTGGLAKGRGARSKATFERLGQALRLPEILPNKTPLASVGGSVQKIEIASQGGHNVYVGNKKHYVPASQGLLVRKGQKVKRGDALGDGIVDPRELLGLSSLQNVQDHLAGEIHGVLSAAAPVRRRNVEVVVKAMTNVTRVDDPKNHPDWVPGDMRNYSKVRSWNSKKKKDSAIEHTPVLKGINVLPLSVQEDWVARLNYNDLGSTIVEAAREGWRSNIHGFHPVPALAYAKEFGKKMSVDDWKGRY